MTGHRDMKVAILSFLIRLELAQVKSLSFQHGDRYQRWIVLQHFHEEFVLWKGTTETLKATEQKCKKTCYPHENKVQPQAHSLSRVDPDHHLLVVKQQGS